LKNKTFSEMGPTEVDNHIHRDLPVSSNKIQAELCQLPMNTVDAPSPSPSSQSLPPASNSASQRALRSEALRLATYQGWALDFLSPRELAAAGFFYRGISDHTMCAFCCITISQWEPHDNPMTEHRRHAPNCPFVLQLNVGNVPLSIGRTERPALTSSTASPVPVTIPAPAQSSRSAFVLPPLGFNGGADTCSRFQSESRPNALPERVPAPRLTTRTSDAGEGTSSAPTDLASLGLLPHQPARHPELSSLEARMNTFADWPPGLKQRPAQLAEAGFYYMSNSRFYPYCLLILTNLLFIPAIKETGDHVKCFCCDGALRNWEPEDDPWVEHARWFYRCNFLVSVKGDEYVKSIQEQFKPISISSLESSIESSSGSETSSESSQESGLESSSSGFSSGSEDVIEPKKMTKDEIKKDAVVVANSEQTTKLRDALLCQICCDEQLSIVFLPCGHSMTCPSCATALTNCPLCRKRIEASVRAFFPFS